MLHLLLYGQKRLSADGQTLSGGWKSTTMNVGTYNVALTMTSSANGAMISGVERDADWNTI